MQLKLKSYFRSECYFNQCPLVLAHHLTTCLGKPYKKEMFLPTLGYMTEQQSSADYTLGSSYASFGLWTYTEGLTDVYSWLNFKAHHF